MTKNIFNKSKQLLKFSNYYGTWKNLQISLENWKSLWWDIRNLTIWQSTACKIDSKLFPIHKNIKGTRIEAIWVRYLVFRNPYLNLSQQVQSCLSSPFNGSANLVETWNWGWNASSSWTHRFFKHRLREQGITDVRENSSLSDRHLREELVELLVVADSQ